MGLGVLGAAALPLLGFGAGGVAAGSVAASWQSSIGLVAAGSLFATLQSLGATGLGILLFGASGAALGVLATIATRLGWCTCEADRMPQSGTMYDFIKRVGSSIKSTVWDSWNYYAMCQVCEKPTVCEENLKQLRKLIISATIACGGVGAQHCPLPALVPLVLQQDLLQPFGSLSLAMWQLQVFLLLSNH